MPLSMSLTICIAMDIWICGDAAAAAVFDVGACVCLRKGEPWRRCAYVLSLRVCNFFCYVNRFGRGCACGHFKTAAGCSVLNSCHECEMRQRWDRGCVPPSRSISLDYSVLTTGVAVGSPSRDTGVSLLRLANSNCKARKCSNAFRS